LLVLFLGLAYAGPQMELLSSKILKSGAYPQVTEANSREFAAYLVKESRALSASRGQRNTSETEGLIRLSTVFNCSTASMMRSSAKPTDAKKLRPGDIDVIAAIGDSVAAGFGALSGSIFTIFTEYRGFSFSVGGESDFEDFLTVANILKKFNPNLKGFAVGNGDADSKNAVLNVAVTGARSYTLPEQVDNLQAKMTKLGVDMGNDWKLITIFVGGNDLCDYCSDTTKNSPDNFRKNLEAILDSIKARFPRVFVNLITPPDVTLLGQVSGGFCSILHTFECGCATDSGTAKAHALYTDALYSLVAEAKYHDKEDFHIGLQPFLSKLTLPLNPDGEPDRSYFAPDCFHFSGKAHQAASIALWNNMAEQPGNKKQNWVPGEPMECPQYLA